MNDHHPSGRFRALEIQQFGQPGESLKLVERESRALGPNEVRLKVMGSPINPADVNLIAGTYGVKPDLPAVAGIEGAGEVIESAQADWQVGDRAMILRGAGWWAEEVCVAADDLFRLPAEIDMRQAAMLRVNPATAWQMLRGFESLDAGDWVVLNAANSGVGRAVIQLAAQRGLRTVGLVRSAAQISGLEALGATHVVLDDSKAVEQVREWVGDQPPRLALNAVGGESALRLMNVLAASGTLVTYGAMARKPLKVPNGMLIFKDLRLRGFWVTQWMESLSPEALREMFGELAQGMIRGQLELPVHRVYPLDQYREAIACMMDSGTVGKVILSPGGLDS